ncbi:MAG: sel1 repeat family protein, partial [Bacteroidetes bacterium]|nr:sel1 repeat family protein [Bacteroidota bacterium]
KDFVKAEKWFLKGAQLTHHNAMYDLADMYATNEVEIQDDVEGLKWLNIVQLLAKSYSKSNEYAQFVLQDKNNIRQKLENRMTQEQVIRAKNLSEAFIKKHSENRKSS